MKRLLETLRGARKIEIFLAAVAIAVLLMQGSSCFQSQSTGTELEQRLEAILARIEDVGRVDVMVNESADGTPNGVLVVAEGADDISVCLRLQYAVQALLGIDASEIEIVRSAK